MYMLLSFAYAIFPIQVIRDRKVYRSVDRWAYEFQLYLPPQRGQEITRMLFRQQRNLCDPYALITALCCQGLFSEEAGSPLLPR